MRLRPTVGTAEDGLMRAIPHQSGGQMGVVTLATYNVLSLSGTAFADNRQEGLAFAPARPTILSAALHACGVNVAGIQEARTEAGTLNTDGFARFCSGADKGKFGVELWFKTNHQIIAGSDDCSEGVVFTPKEFTVLHADPRRIFVLFTAAKNRFLFSSLHAPHRGAESPILTAWWAETKRLLERFASKGAVFLLGDFNAAVGSLTSRSVGDLCADTQDESGDHLHDTLRRLSLWLPSTFHGIHEGPSGTYVQKRNQAESRNDYVAIPSHLEACNILSWRETRIHAGQPVIDHIAALVRVSARGVLARPAYWQVRQRLRCAVRFHEVAAAFASLRCGHGADRAAYLGSLADSVGSGGHQAHEDLSYCPVESAYRPNMPGHTVGGKACGPDGIPAELGRSQPVDCGSYRAIMLLSVVAKTFHRAFRPAIYRFFEDNSLPIQLGGKKNATVLYGSHISRAYGKWCAVQGISTIILFADVSAAYYSAVRALTARGSEEDQGGQATDWLQALTHDLNHRTWMTLNSDDAPVLTTQGSRPGSSWADLFFGITIPGILAIRDQMRSASPKKARDVVIQWDGWKGFFDPPPAECPQPATAALDDVVWADDLASYLGVAQPEEAASLIGTEASFLNDSFRSYGYSLSFGVSKTAAVVHLRGPGARAARRHLFSLQKGVPALSEAGPAEHLPLVPAYKHLGVRVTANNSLLPEIKQRVAAAWVSFRQGKTKVFRSKRLGLEKKGAILASHVLSKLTFSCGAWGPLRQGEMTLFARTVVSMYRQCLGLAFAEDQHVTTATICALVRQAEPGTLLLVERLRYARQLVTNGPDVLWALLRSDAEFLKGMREAFDWLFAWIRATAQYCRNPANSWEPWVRLMTTRQGRFRGLVKRAKALEIIRVASYAALQALLRSLCQIGGAVNGPGRSDPERPERYQEACLICRIAFPTRASWAVHAAKKHGYRAPATLLSQEQEKPLCLGCGRLYANRHRLRRHLLHAQQCRTKWGSFHPTGEVATELHVQLPPMQVQGDECPEFRPDSVYIHPGLVEALLALSPPDADGVWRTLLDFAEPLDVLQWSLRDWAARPDAPQNAGSIAEDACLLLDPELWCEDFRKGKRGPLGFLACADLHRPESCRLNFVLSGVTAVFKVDDPPLPEFVYPFRHSVPLATARRHLDWLEQACDTVNAFLSSSQHSPVFLEASSKTLSCLEPVMGWAVEAGFAPRPGGLGSPL
ncbi:unnamed protein product [Symbiodinium necroappetens]|uniref:Endonuclease/exonuclease/phosphatase domain-containing protein n=1 Tax=Symbiodinium necroappetens TaxID=1628268 RepID=A0A812MW01_9DINO|nr:unnamed protein product [Symbiodinium necroappetens]